MPPIRYLQQGNMLVSRHEQNMNMVELSLVYQNIIKPLANENKTCTVRPSMDSFRGVAGCIRLPPVK